MGVTFKQGQVWENDNGHKLRIVDDKVAERTEIYFTPITLEIEPVDDADLPACATPGDTDTEHRVSRDTLVQECDLVQDSQSATQG